MKFEDLLQDKIFKLPIEKPKNQSFETFITEFLTNFLSKVNQLDSEYLQFESIGIDPVYIKRAQQRIINGLKKTIQEYHNGFPFKAYEQFNDALKNDLKDLYEIIKQETYETNQNFYRIRQREENIPFKTKELFHIPFESRGKVSTQRFSIPGFPSLYLGRTLYVCWEELNRPKMDEFQAIRLENKRPIKYLDLTPPNPENSSEEELYWSFMIFPLVACCSVKVDDYSDTFKPQYIIPQLLLQWVRDNDDIDGIKYKSTHISTDLYNQDGELANIVLPVKNSKQAGHCHELISMFRTTQVVSWQLYEYALGGQTFMRTRKEEQEINDKLPMLELIKGRKYPYSYSILGKLEGYLDKMDTREID